MRAEMLQNDSNLQRDDKGSYLIDFQRSMDWVVYFHRVGIHVVSKREIFRSKTCECEHHNFVIDNIS
jgi:hypothetical protein